LKPKKYSQIQRIKRLENIASQMYYSQEVIKKEFEQLKKLIDKLLEKENKNK
jgi:hypothetical protein